MKLHRNNMGQADVRRVIVEKRKNKKFATTNFSNRSGMRTAFFSTENCSVFNL